MLGVFDIALWFALGTAGASDTAPAVPAHRPLPERLPALRVEVAPGTHLRLGIGVQVRGDVAFPDDGEPKATLALARLRLTPSVSLFDGRLVFVNQLNLVPGRLELIDLYLEGTPHPAVRVRAGWTKIPLSRYRDQSVFHLAMVDWAATSRMFGGERQVGVFAHDGYDGGVDWALGVFTGANGRASHGVGLVDTYSLPSANPSSLTDPAWDWRVRPELVGRIGWTTPGMNPLLPPGRGDPLGVYAAIGAAWDARPEPGRDHTLRVVPEVALTWRGLWLDVVGHVGLVDSVEDGVVLGQTGTLVALGARPHRHVELVARVTHLTWSDALRRDVVARTGEPSGSPAQALEAGGGVGVPILGPHLELSLDVQWRGAWDQGTRVSGDVLGRTQVQVFL